MTSIIRIITLSALLAIVIDHVAARSRIDTFRFQPSKITVGAVYHYLKTNIDGTRPEHVSVYVAARDRLESFKYHPKAGRAGLVIATMDWSTFSVKRLESWQVFRGAERKLFATLGYLPPAKAVEVSIPAMGKQAEKISINHLPFHVYNFDLTSLNFAFRHLASPRKNFTVSIADPTFLDEGPLFRYRGEVGVEYVGEEIRHGAMCRKYRIDGPGLENRGGIIWVNKKGGYFQDVEIKLANNPGWQSFKLKLTGVERMSRKAWEAFIRSQF